MKYNTTVENLKRINAIKRGRVLKVGVKIKLPGGVQPSDAKDGQSKNQNSQDSTQKKIYKGKKLLVAKHKGIKSKVVKSKVVKPKKSYHIVRRGENLEKIASRYEIDLSDFKTKNKIKNTSRILVGQRLLIPNVN